MPQNTFSMINLFTSSGLTVQIISILLLFASIYSWSVIIEKLRFIAKIKKETNNFESKFWQENSIDNFYKKTKLAKNSPILNIFNNAMKQWEKSKPSLESGISEAKANNIYQRIERIMHTSIEKESEKINKKMGVLATVGSVSPFIGLFGTVWGIMQAFSAIGNSQSTSIGIIAPGVATALSTTALGLIAAIPAVIFYNKLSTDLMSIETRLENFTSEFMSIISQKIDKYEEKTKKSKN